jgi:hypothetical protein
MCGYVTCVPECRESVGTTYEEAEVLLMECMCRSRAGLCALFQLNYSCKRYVCSCWK